MYADESTLLINQEIQNIKKQKYILILGFLACVQVISYFVYLYYDSNSFDRYLLFTFFAPFIFFYFVPNLKKINLFVFAVASAIKIYICFSIENINVLALFYTFLTVEAINVFSLIF